MPGLPFEVLSAPVETADEWIGPPWASGIVRHLVPPATAVQCTVGVQGFHTHLHLQYSER